MSRGGYFPVKPSQVLHGFGWAGRTPAALGAWLLIKSLSELTEEPVLLDEAARLGITDDALAELEANGLLDQAPDGLRPLGMAAVKSPNPSDSPEAIRRRVAAYRERQRQAKAGNDPAPQASTSSSSVQCKPVTSVTPLPVVTTPSDEPETGEKNDLEGTIGPIERPKTTPTLVAPRTKSEPREELMPW